MDTSAAPVNAIGHTDDPAPTPMGGAIAGGTYYLTRMMYHGGTPITGPGCLYTYSYVLDITATSDTEGTIAETMSSVGSNFPVTWTYLASGTKVEGPRLCGLTGPRGETYSATPNEILWFRMSADTGCYKDVMIVFTFTKQ